MQRNEPNSESSAIPTVSPLINDEEKFSLQAELDQAGFDDGQSSAAALYRAGFKHGQRATLAFLEQQALENEEAHHSSEEKSTSSLDDTTITVDSADEEELLSDDQSTSSTETLNTPTVAYHSNLGLLTSDTAVTEASVSEEDAKEQSVVESTPSTRRGINPRNRIDNPDLDQPLLTFRTTETEEPVVSEDNASELSDGQPINSTGRVSTFFSINHSSQRQPLLSNSAVSIPPTNYSTMQTVVGEPPPNQSSAVLIIKWLCHQMWFPSLFWPTAWWGLLIHDVLNYYYNSPENRYGTTEKDVWLGLPLSDPYHLGNAVTNQATWLNYFISDRVPDTKATLDPIAILRYWGPLSGVIAFTLFMPLVQYLLIKSCLRETDSRRDSNSSSLAMKIVLWGIFASYVALPHIRSLSLFIQKSAETINYFKEHDACPDVYLYLKAIEQYACNICGNWEDVHEYLNDIDSDQGCLNGLLSKNRDPFEILTKLQQLNASRFTSIDFSKVHIAAWSNDSFEKVMAYLSVPGLHLDYFNFAQSSNRFDTISQEKMITIIYFLHTVNVSTLISSNQLLRGTIGTVFFNGLQNTTVTQLIAANCALGDIADEAFENVFANSFITTADLSNGQMSDLKRSSLLNGIRRSKSLISLIVDDNPFSDPFCIDMAAALNQTRLQHLGMAGMAGITRKCTGALGTALSQYPLKGLGIERNSLGSQETIAFAPGLSKSKVESLSYSGNDLSVPYTAEVFFQSLPPTLKTLDIHNVQLSKDGIAELVKFIMRSIVENMNVSENNFDLNAWKDFIIAVATSKIKNLIARSNNLGNDEINAFADAVRNKVISITGFDLGNNQANDDSMIGLLISFGDNHVENIVLVNNLLSDAFCLKLASLIPGGSYRLIDISDNKPMTGLCTQSLVSATRSNNTVDTLLANGLRYTSNDYNAIAKLLIQSPYDLSPLENNDMGIDATRALASSTTPASSISRLEIQASDPANMGVSGPRSLGRVQPRTHIPSGHLLYTLSAMGMALNKVTANLLFLAPASHISDESDNTVTNNNESFDITVIIMLALFTLLVLLNRKSISQLFIASKNRLFGHGHTELNTIEVVNHRHHQLTVHFQQ